MTAGLSVIAAIAHFACRDLAASHRVHNRWESLTRSVPLFRYFLKMLGQVSTIKKAVAIKIHSYEKVVWYLGSLWRLIVEATIVRACLYGLCVCTDGTYIAKSAMSICRTSPQSTLRKRLLDSAILQSPSPISRRRDHLRICHLFRWLDAMYLGVDMSHNACRLVHKVKCKQNPNFWQEFSKFHCPTGYYLLYKPSRWPTTFVKALWMGFDRRQKFYSTLCILHNK